MIVVLNNKSNLTREEYVLYEDGISKLKTKSKLILCPTFLNIGLTANNITLGAQNVSCTESGAYTGEISASQLKSANVEYCLVGHSERRTYYKESLKDIENKIKMLLKENITPILCIGETKEERDNHKVEEVLYQEINSAIKELTEEEKNKIVVAYEPIWSIGTGIIPKTNEIENILKFIKKSFQNSKILYGGSVNEENVDTLKKISLIDGYLLGGLSLKTNQLKIFLNKLDD